MTDDPLRHYWHAVAIAEELKDEPMPARLLDVPIVLWRSGGKAVALHDLCIHRGTRLSLGWVENDELVCRYHGWSYDCAGACTRIPSLPSERPIPRKARVTHLHGTIHYWLHTLFRCMWFCLSGFGGLFLDKPSRSRMKSHLSVPRML